MAVARDFLWAAHPSMKSFQFRPEGFLHTAQCCTLNKESCLRIDGVKSMRLHASVSGSLPSRWGLRTSASLRAVDLLCELTLLKLKIAVKV